MEKVFIIVNPSAGDEKAPEVSKQLEEIYQEQHVQTKVYETTGDDPFKEIIQDAMGDGYQTVALLGGDGTISKLVNSVVGLEHRPKIILLPSGTTNNFARTLTDNKTRAQILEAIKEKELEEIKVDVGQMNDQYFVSSIAVGALPAVGWETDEDLKANLGSFAYFLEGLKSVTAEEQDSFDVEIKVNGKPEIKEDVFFLIIGLSNSIFGIQTFFEDATVNDGQLHYFGLKEAGIFREMGSVIKQIINEEKQAEDDRTFRGTLQEAVIESESAFHFLIDGEKGPTFPVKVGILPEHLTFIIPTDEN